MDIYSGLNPAQLAAVKHTDGPLLIMAGAGSGKTRVLTYRIAHLLEEGVSPYRILAITFTNKAATEMKERVDKLIGSAAQGVILSTFHSFCARILRREAEATGKYGQNFVIYDTADAQTVIKNCLKALNLDSKQYAPGVVLGRISKAKNALESPDDCLAAASPGSFDGNVAKIYELYAKELLENNAMDFDDLLLVAVDLLTNNEAVREKYQERFRYIMVDEYQDTNVAQYKLTKLLAAKYRNLCVVGDGDQSIYGWRGADMRNILNFEKDYPEAKSIMLEQNYRSTKVILQAANAVIAHNKERKPKNLWTDNQVGEKITLYNALSERDEADYIASTVMDRHKQGAPYSDAAVLYRTNAQSRAIEEGLMRYGVPYVMVGGLKFYDRKEIKDILAYLRVIYNPMDSVSLLRIINVPRRGIGAATIAKLNEYAAATGSALFDIIADIDTLKAIPGVSARARNPLENLAVFILEGMNKVTSTPLDTFIEWVLNESGYVKELEAEKKPENETRLENIKELITAAQDFQRTEAEPTLENFLSNVALVSDIDSADLGEDRVTLMTLHSAKGLEFPVVFMAGMEDGIFPHARSMDSESAMEEERRACYVGITRARRKLFMTYAMGRTIYGRDSSNPPSEFLGEIPDECLEEASPFEAKRPQTPKAEPMRGTGGGFTASVQSGYTAWENTRREPAKKATQTVTAGTASPTRPDTALVWQVGDKAKHAKWGVGTVVAVKKKSDDTYLSVAFPNNGVKELMQKYAPLEKV